MVCMFYLALIGQNFNAFTILNFKTKISYQKLCIIDLYMHTCMFIELTIIC